MKDVYFISGLGAQCRIFDRIVLPEIYIRHYLEFILPDVNDDLESYALRMGCDIKEGSVLIGLSLGGMMASEIAKSRPDLKVILLSSIPVKKEFPLYLTSVLNAGIHRLINDKMLKNIFPFLSRRIIANSFDQSTQDLLIDMLRQNDTDLYKWFLEAIKLWCNSECPDNIIRIHGTSDRVLPISDVRKINCLIKGGSHVMLLDRYNEINDYLRKVL